MPRALELGVDMKAAGGIPRGLRCYSPQSFDRSGGGWNCQVLWAHLPRPKRQTPTRRRGALEDGEGRRLDALGARARGPAALPGCMAAERSARGFGADD